MDRSLLIQNFLKQSYHALRENERFMQERSTKSYFEWFWDSLNNAFSMGVKGYRPPNSTVESFYRGTLDAEEFCIQVRETVVDKCLDKLDTNLDPLLSLSWDTYSCVPSRKRTCSGFPRLCSRQLWGIFNRLDVDSSCFVSIEDITLVIMKLYQANGKEESPCNIREWFCDQQTIDFWLFFSALVEYHSDLLSPPVLLVIYEEIFFEILKEGKMKKKGHKVANWKERWFVLSSSQLYYYESQENRSLKGTVTINRNSKVDKLSPLKDHSYLFRVTDGKTGIPYDVSTRDPQMLNDWMQMVQVVIAAQSEERPSTLQNIQMARERLFPHTVQASLPKYKQSGAAEYNEGVYRVVPPSLKKDCKSSSSNSDLISLEAAPQMSSLPQTAFEKKKKKSSLSSSPPPPEEGEWESPATPTYTYQTVDIGPQSNAYTLSNQTLEPFAQSSHTYVNVPGPGDPMQSTDPYNPDLDVSSLSPSPPPVSIKQSFNNTGHSDKYISVKHTSVQGKDYTVIDKVLRTDDLPTKSQAYEQKIRSPLPSLPPTSDSPTYPAVEKPKGQQIKPYKKNSSCSNVYPNPGPDYANITRTGDPMCMVGLDQYSIDSDPRSSPLSPSLSPSPPPVSIKQSFNNVVHGEDFINIKPTSASVQGRDLVDGSLVKEENYPSSSQTHVKPAPAPRKKSVSPTRSLPIQQTNAHNSQPVPVVESDKQDYSLLDFGDETPPETTLMSPDRPNGMPVPKPRSQIPKTRFDYSEVLLEDSNVKDVDAALQLKANRPPPTPPSKYNPKYPPGPTPPNRQESKSKSGTPVMEGSNNNAQYLGFPLPNDTNVPLMSPPSTIDDAPPPPPRRVASNRTSTPTDRFPNSYPPVPPPR